MIGLDTNVLVRYLVQDDPSQAARANRLIERELTPVEPGFIGIIVLVETLWVLRNLYRATPDEIRNTVAELLSSDRLELEHRDVVARALATAGIKGCGMADAIIAASARSAGCKRVVSFDRGAVSAGMTLLK